MQIAGNNGLVPYFVSQNPHFYPEKEQTPIVTRRPWASPLRPRRQLILPFAQHYLPV